MPIEPIESGFAFTKDWRNETDFPTYEGDENTVRSDMQLLHEEMKNYVNGTLIEIINALVDAVNQIVSVSVPDHSITNEKLDGTEDEPAETVDWYNIKNLAVKTEALANLAVVTAKLANGAVNNDKVYSGNDNSQKIDYEKCRIHAVTTLPTGSSPEGIYLYYSAT